MEARLDLYELDHHDPVAYLDWGGILHLPDNTVPRPKEDRWEGPARAGLEGLPVILFADVPVMIHLSNGISLAPFDRASEQTGPA